MPALACIDDMAGDAVLNACEKALFGSADSTAAAVAYAASKITRLTSFGDVAAADKYHLRTAGAAPCGRARPLRPDGVCAGGARPLYGLRLRAFRSLADIRQIATNLDERHYDSLVTRYASSWNAPQAARA